MPINSPYPSIHIPKRDLWDFLFEGSRDGNYPEDKVIYRSVDGARAYTFAEVRDTARTFGQALQDIWQWQKGEVLGFLAPNDVDWMPCVYGAIFAGSIVSPANPAYTADEFAYMLKDSGAKAIATHLSVLPTALKAAKIAGVAEDKIVLLGAEGVSSGSVKHFKSLRSSRSSGKCRPVKQDPDEDLAFLAYSSGTTGLPKGVMLCHRNLVANVLQLRHTIGHNLDWRSDKLLGVLPFFHIYGLTALLHMALHRGLELVIMPAFNLEAFCEAIQRHKTTFTFIAPPVLVQLSRGQNVKNYDLSSMRMLTSGAAPLTKELVNAVYDRTGLKVNQAYGLSETSPASHVLPWENWKTHMGSVGNLVPNMTAKYMSDDGKEVPAGERGELWMKGPNVFKGYWKKPEATKNAFSEDGYFKTGDVGSEDTEHNFYISDRVKELIKYQGFQVAPAELEGLLLDCPYVEDVAVIGVFLEEQQTEAPRAYIVPAKGHKPSDKLASEIDAWLNPRVAYFKKLRGGIKFIDLVPKSPSGKILRRILKDQAKAESKQGRAKL